jgi:ferredoxin
MINLDRWFLMAKFKIIFDRNNCVAAGPCAAVDPVHFKIDPSDGKAILIGGKEVSPGIFELEVDDDDLGNQAAAVCPAAVITIKKL